MTNSLVQDLKIIQWASVVEFDKKAYQNVLRSHVADCSGYMTTDQRELLDSAIKAKTKFGVFNMCDQLLVSLGYKGR